MRKLSRIGWIAIAFIILSSCAYVGYQQIVVLPRQREAIFTCRTYGGYDILLPSQGGLNWFERTLAEISPRLQRHPPHGFAFEEPVTDEDIEAIEDVPDIGELTIESKGISDRTIQRILEPSRLYCLSIRNANITDNGLKFLRRAPLEQLIVVNSRATHVGLFQLNFSRISNLEVNLALLSESTREERRKLAKLESLRIAPDDPSRSLADWTFLRECTQLTNLEIVAPVDDAAIAEIVKLPRLVWLDATGIHDRHLQSLSLLSRLEVLEVTGDFTGSGLASLTGSMLGSLSISSESLQDSSLASLAGMPQLRQVEIQSSRLTVAGLAHLARCPKLTNMLIVGANISNDDANSFRLFTGLKNLTLKNTRVTTQGADTIQTSLPNVNLAIFSDKSDALDSKMPTPSR